MRRFPALFALLLPVMFHSSVFAGQPPDLSSLPAGFRYCPAPWADNSEFNSSYFAVDARTGVMSRYVDGAPREELNAPVDETERVLYVSPPINVENRYVPPQHLANNPPYPGFQQRQPMQPAHGPNFGEPMRYRQPQQPQPDPAYAHTPPPQRPRQEQGQKQPWWKRVMQ